METDDASRAAYRASPPLKDPLQRPFSQASTVAPGPHSLCSTPLLAGAYGGARRVTTGGRSATMGSLASPPQVPPKQRPGTAAGRFAGDKVAVWSQPGSPSSWQESPLPVQGTPCAPPLTANTNSYRRPVPGRSFGGGGGGCFSPNQWGLDRHRAQPSQPDCIVPVDPSLLIEAEPSSPIAAQEICQFVQGCIEQSLGPPPDLPEEEVLTVALSTRDEMEDHPWADALWDRDRSIGWKDLQRRAQPPAGTLFHKAVLRFERPGTIWNTDLWRDARNEVIACGNYAGVSHLMSLVRLTTEEVIHVGKYKVEEHGIVKPLSVDLLATMQAQASVQWRGQKNLRIPPPMKDRSSLPPILISQASALDVAVNLRRRAGPYHTIVLVAEIMSFDEATGRMDLRSADSVAPTDLLLRTDFARYCEAAEYEAQSARVPRLKNHMRALEDPYVIHCPNVTIFRGPHEDGYPFYKEPVQVHVIAYSLVNQKPDVQVVVRRKQGVTEWYAQNSDHSSLIDRLNLIAMAVFQNNVIADMSNESPSLITCLPGCMGLAAHPKDSLAYSFKHWRRLWSRYFHSVFICCRDRGGGDVDTAAYLNFQVNKYKFEGSEMMWAANKNWDVDLKRLESMSHASKKKEEDDAKSPLSTAPAKHPHMQAEYDEKISRHAMCMEMRHSLRKSSIIQAGSVLVMEEGSAPVKVEIESNSSSDADSCEDSPLINGLVRKDAAMMKKDDFDDDSAESDDDTIYHAGRFSCVDDALALAAATCSADPAERVPNKKYFNPGDVSKCWFNVRSGNPTHGKPKGGLRNKIRHIVQGPRASMIEAESLASKQRRQKAKQKKDLSLLLMGRIDSCRDEEVRCALEEHEEAELAQESKRPDSPRSPFLSRSRSPNASKRRSAGSVFSSGCPTRQISAGSELQAVSEMEQQVYWPDPPDLDDEPMVRKRSKSLTDTMDYGLPQRQVSAPSPSRPSMPSRRRSYSDLDEPAPRGGPMLAVLERGESSDWKTTMQRQRRHSCSIEVLIGAATEVFQHRDKTPGPSRQTSVEDHSSSKRMSLVAGASSLKEHSDAYLDSREEIRRGGQGSGKAQVVTDIQLQIRQQVRNSLTSKRSSATASDARRSSVLFNQICGSTAGSVASNAFSSSSSLSGDPPSVSVEQPHDAPPTVHAPPTVQTEYPWLPSLETIASPTAAELRAESSPQESPTLVTVAPLQQMLSKGKQKKFRNDAVDALEIELAGLAVKVESVLDARRRQARANHQKEQGEKRVSLQKVHAGVREHARAIRTSLSLEAEEARCLRKEHAGVP